MINYVYNFNEPLYEIMVIQLLFLKNLKHSNIKAFINIYPRDSKPVYVFEQTL